MQTENKSWIEAEHPDYRARRHVMARHRDLYIGGEKLRTNATDYLLRRRKEPLDIYQERLNRVFYENYVGSIIDWYVATLFRREPLITIEGDDARGRRFLSAFTEDCDLQGTSITEFFRRRILDALVCGASYILIDFPRADKQPETLAEEDMKGTSRAYLSECNADQLINWGQNEQGELDWVVIRTEAQRQEKLESDHSKETRWLYYDRQKFRMFLRRDSSTPESPIRMIDEGCHGLAALNRVPIISMQIPDGLWLMNKAGLLQLEHFNKSNALSWALTLGLFATPVVYSEREWSQIIGDSYFIQLGPQDRFGWTEPQGHVYQIAADNLSRLQQEIYRVCYLLSQAGGPLGGQSESGLSKQRDFQITQEVLRAYGDIVKETMKRVLRTVIAVRQDKVAVDVNGLDEFDIGDFSGELADAERLLSLGVPSATLKKQIFKKLALKFLCDTRQEVKDRIASEIDKGMEVAD